MICIQLYTTFLILTIASQVPNNSLLALFYKNQQKSKANLTLNYLYLSRNGSVCILVKHIECRLVGSQLIWSQLINHNDTTPK